MVIAIAIVIAAVSLAMSDGALASLSVTLGSAEEVAALIRTGRKALGGRIGYVHPHCGERSLNRETAFQKNANMTMARDDVFYGEAEEPRGSKLKERQHRSKGYFLVTVDRERKELVVSFHTHKNRLVKRYRSRFAEKLLPTISADADSLGISRRHLAYLTLELGRAEASLGPPSLLYRQRTIE
jgi:hypothetical protein